MEFEQVVQRRRMVRSFEDTPVDDAVIRRILRNANRAPSAGFAQGYAFLVLRGPSETGRFWAAVHGGQGYGEITPAPVIIVPLACKRAYLDRYAEPDKGWTDRDESRWPVPYWHIDTGFAALLALLTVVDEGLGAVFFGIPPADVNAFRAAFGVPDDHEPIGAIAIGHPTADERPLGSAVTRQRRPLEEVAHWGRW